MMVDDFDKILDECLDRINRGEKLEDCLSAYPAYAERLKTLVESAVGVRSAYTFSTSADAKRKARLKFQAALEEGKKTSPFAFLSFLTKPVVWAPVAVLVLALIAAFVIRPAVGIVVNPPPVLAAHPQGNFAFLISDSPNDIGDFESLNVTISKVQLESSNGTLQFVPEVNTVDLTKLQGAESQEIWRGNVPAGQYSEVIINVSQVKGTLKATGTTIDVKLPSNKMRLSIPFETSNETVTNFTFDITVIKTGNSGKYILKPQVGESGTQQEPKPIQQEQKAIDKPNQNKGKGKTK